MRGHISRRRRLAAWRRRAERRSPRCSGSASSRRRPPPSELKPRLSRRPLKRWGHLLRLHSTSSMNMILQSHQHGKQQVAAAPSLRVFKAELDVIEHIEAQSW